MIESVLVANRGEIARRIFRSCRELGIRTVAVYSDADAGAPHVTEADAAVRLPGSAPADTYLRGDLLVRAARAAGADAVHPGYGFLSENAEFARSVTAAGLVWIGPPPAAIEAMASKTRAKELMGEAGVPQLAPVPPESATTADLPLLVKASAGGGGRGMRIVRELAALPGEVEAAQAEAESAFGDGEVFTEPYVERGRHVEVQVLADTHGTVWALGTRDCSLQRRHQKVIEEAPAPALSDSLRNTLHSAAVRAAQTVGYQGAGTVEFLVSAPAEPQPDSGRPEGPGHEQTAQQAYFLEMNTRLQVEHPVTEWVYGLDLVAEQIRVAEGAPLPAEGPQAPQGHAVEARLYAEDPARGWQPQTGTLHRLAVPDGVRLDSGVADGCHIGVHYDPMLAKVIAWAQDRRAAVRKLAGALERAAVHGPVTNRTLLLRSLRHPDFTAARLDTGFYDRHLDTLTAEPEWTPATPDQATPSAGTPAAPRPAELAALAAALADADRTRDAGRTVSGRLGGWRNVPAVPQHKRYRTEPDGTELDVRYRTGRSGPASADFPQVTVVRTGPGRVTLELGGVEWEFAVSTYPDTEAVYVDSPLGAHTLTALPRFTDPAERSEPGSLFAQLPGTVVRVAEHVTAGATVAEGQPLLWLEAMKMEHKVVAPAAGTLTALHVATGSQVEVGTLLAVVSQDATGPEFGEPRQDGKRQAAEQTQPSDDAQPSEQPGQDGPLAGPEQPTATPPARPEHSR